MSRVICTARVMAGPVPAIHDFATFPAPQGVDTRPKAGHDGVGGMA